MDQLALLNSIIEKNRSYRRFYNEEIIYTGLLKTWINLARLSPSARNMQSLKYKFVNDKASNAKIFPLLSWAGYIEDWDGPIESERPSAYIIVLNDEKLTENHFCDEGIASQSILLGAVASGFGGCMIAAIKRKELRLAFSIDEQYKILHIIALGKPKEDIVIEDLKNNDNKYWRDKDQVHHVPKRSLDDLIIS